MTTLARSGNAAILRCSSFFGEIEIAAHRLELTYLRRRPEAAVDVDVVEVFQDGCFCLIAPVVGPAANFRKANLRCDAGLFDNTSLGLFFRSAQDAVLAQHVCTELRRLARSQRLRTGTAGTGDATGCSATIWMGRRRRSGMTF